MSVVKFECPACGGDGGHTEPVIDYGMGPFYPCQFCNEKGYVGLWKSLIWWWTVERHERNVGGDV